MSKIVENDVEEANIEYFQDLGYQYLHGQDLAPDGLHPERDSYTKVILKARLISALTRINPHLSSDKIEEVAKKLINPDNPSLIENNYAFQSLLTKGVSITIRKDGQDRGDQAWLVDFDNPDKNDWLVVNQFTVTNGNNKRRPDLVVFLNGLPLAVIELKNPASEEATIESAFNQLQTYKTQIPDLFNTNQLLIISDGIEAKVGSLTAGKERFGEWRTIDGNGLASSSTPKLEVLILGLFEKRRFLDYIKHFILWDTEDGFIKKIAGYHQYHAVNKAIRETVRASSPNGDKRIGVIWHTQGSGKSISMAFYTGKLVTSREMKNPTVLVITDRNDLDGQLYSQFCTAKGLMPTPQQAESSDHLKELLQVESGGIIFSTIQKFGTSKGVRFSALSQRRNIVVVTDEAHRSQYEFVEGFARNLRDALPNASFIGFTGTPIEFNDKNTPAVFGDYIDTYTIGQAVEDNATVPIYYEARLAKIKLPEDKTPKVDFDFDEVTEGEEEQVKENLKSRWARLEAMVGTDERLQLIAQDILDHFEARLKVIDGKAMIVVMSRRIAVDLYNKIISLKPDWAGQTDVNGFTPDESGNIKVVMTGSASDPDHFTPHIRNKIRLKVIEKRFKDPNDPLKLVIVRDMWLTGFDAPCAHTLYTDKPMKGHGLMQAIARVNRVFKDKPSGLVVDYIGLADQLKEAVKTYSGSKKNRPGIPVEEALAVLREKYEIIDHMFHGFDYTGYFSSRKSACLAALCGGVDHIYAIEDGKKRFFDGMTQLNKACGLALHLEGARDLRDGVGYFQSVLQNMKKYLTTGKSNDDLNTAIKQIVSKAVTSEGIVNILDELGISKPNIAILSDEFIENIKTSPYRNLQLELLKKLINDEIKSVSRKNVVQSRRFSEMLKQTLNAYQNRTIDSITIILELIDLALHMRDQPKRGAELGLNEDEMAFYDALIDHGNVKDLMSDQQLASIAQDLVNAIRSSVTIDWTAKESVRANMRRKVKRLLREHGYPPDKQEEALWSVIEQAEVVCRDWSSAV